MREYTPQELDALIPHPVFDANKYSRGKAVVIAGCARYPGAAVLASRATQYAGAGYTRVYVAPESVDVVRMSSPSLVVSAWGHWDAAEGPQPSVIGRPVAYVIGSGLDSADPVTTSLLQQILEHAAAPVVIDGGALGALCGFGFLQLCQQRSGRYDTILTPHAAEAAALAHAASISETEPDNLARELAKAYNAVCILKGPTTYCSDGIDVYPLTESTPALAKAGTGDVLAGIVGGFAAQGMEALDAAILAVVIHSRAGRIAAERMGDVSVCAENVLEAMPTALSTEWKGDIHE